MKLRRLCLFRFLGSGHYAVQKHCSDGVRGITTENQANDFRTQQPLKQSNRESLAWQLKASAPALEWNEIFSLNHIAIRVAQNV